jgi:hypothetical protein
MDYFEGVVIDYLRADRAVFVNTECCIQLNPGRNPDTSGPHWYCDAVAVNHRERMIYLCEISYSKSLAALEKRLTGWNMHWGGVQAALIRDCHLPDWPVPPWVFIPAALVTAFNAQFEKALCTAEQVAIPLPKVTTLEDVLPWKYRSWDRQPDVEPS